MAIVPRKPHDARNAKVLIHSPAGHGKTHLLGTAQEDPRTYPMAFINFEGGEQTLAGLDIDVFDVRDWRDFDEVYRTVADPSSPYNSVGVDSISESQVAGLLDILDRDRARADPDQLAQADWGIIRVRMQRMLRQFVRRLDKHVFMTALTKEDVVPRVGQVKVPSVQGGIANDLPGIFDVVAYLALEDTEEGTERLLLLHSYPRFSVKARTPWGASIPTEIVDPTIGLLLDAMGVDVPTKKAAKAK
jgi:hypothetical protein